MIIFQDLYKEYNNHIILNQVSGSFQRGKINLIIGTSGTGKSVLLKCLVGITQPTSGRVEFDGRDIINGNKNIIISIKIEIGMLFQSSALFDSKTIEQNVKFPLDMLTNMPNSEKLDRVHFYLKRVGLENISHKFPNEISGGMQKRVGIARAIVNDAKYLFCDEPNSGLDPQTSLLIDELIQEITYEYNITTVVVTHNLDTIFTIGDQIMFLSQGNKEWEGDSKSLFLNDVKPLQEFLLASKMMQVIMKKAVYPL